MVEQFEPSKRRQRKKKKRPRKKRIILTAILLLFVILFLFVFIQYRSGLKIAKNDDSTIDAGNFIGDEDNGKVTNYLLLGVDSRDGEISRTDTMMVLSKNKETNEYKLVSFMRDIYAEIPGYKNYKLNTAYFLGEKDKKGVQLLKETLNNMFDIPIHHYAIVDFKNFETIVDIIAPDGVEIDVEKDMSKNIGVSLKEGKQVLNGKELLGYARFRKDAEGDFGRVRRQQQVISAVKEQVLTPSNIVNLPKLAGAIQGYVATDLSTTNEIKLALSIIGADSDLEKLTIPVEGSYKFASYSHAGSVIEIDVEKNKQELHKFLGIE